MSVDVRHQRGVAKGKKIRQKWPDVDNPSGYPRLRIVAESVGWRKRRGKKKENRTKKRATRKRDERISLKNGRCTFRSLKRYGAEIRSMRRLILFWKLGLAWPWQTRHLQIVYGDGSILSQGSSVASPLSHTACLESFARLVRTGCCWQVFVSEANLARSSFSRSLIDLVICWRRSNLKGERSIRRHDIGRSFFTRLLFSPLLIFLCTTGQIW